MLDKETIDHVRREIAPQSAPVLSLYLDVNPAKPENGGGAPIIRAKEAIKAAQVPKDLAARLTHRLEEEYGVAPQARTLVVFAGEDPDRLYETYPLQLELELPGNDGVLARWGEPHVTPLMQAFDDNPRSGIVFVDQERWRYFEVFMGEIEERQDAFLALDTSDWRERGGKSTEPGVPARGGSAEDQYGKRKDAWTHRFYNQAAELLADTIREGEVEQLVLIGPSQRTQEFLEALPQQVRELVIDQLPQPANPNANAAAILELAQPALERGEEARERRLLERLAEGGISGVARVLTALQEGRLQILVTTREFDHTVYACSEGGRLTADAAAAERECLEGRYEIGSLRERLPDLAAAYGARLTYLRGGAAAQLSNQHGGIAGIARW